MDLAVAHAAPESLGHRVHRLRAMLGLSQQELARRIGVSQPRISQIERDRSLSPLPLRTLCDLADALGVDVDALVSGDPLYDVLELEDMRAFSVPPPALARSALPLLGRAGDLAALQAMLRSDAVRLLTLVGTAGVGKTQLALHAIAALASTSASESIAVSLAECVDNASVVTAIARAIGLRERDAQPLRQRLMRALHEGQLLLLLDNVEQAVDAVAPLAAELLLACPKMTLLATSRMPLAIHDEQTYVVHPLALPDARLPISLDAATAAPAVQLFTQRARAVVPGFTLTEANTASIVTICRRLDGLPLAIELAAPRLRVLSPAQLVRQLERRLEALSAGSRDVPPRQRSLRASIAWSVDLLNPEQRALFRRLAVFTGGFTLETAEWVAGRKSEVGGTHTPNGTTEWPSRAVADDLSLLLEQHLLTRVEQADGAPRFGMLETIHEYARELLEAVDESVEMHHRHLAWCLSLAEEAAPKLFTAEEPSWLARLQQEDANLQAALAWAFGAGRDTDLEAGLRLGGALADYWFLNGRFSEGRAVLIEAIALSARRAPSLGRARALVGACLIEQTQAAIEPALFHGEQGLALAEPLGDQPTIGRALLLLGNLALMQGEFSRAHAFHEQALACFRRLGDPAWTAVALVNLGDDFYRQGRLDQAAACAADALAITRAIGSLWDTSAALRLLGAVARDRGDLDQATALFSEALTLGRRHGSERTITIADALSGIGTVAVASAALERAARLLGAAEALYRGLEITIPPPLWPDWEATVERVRDGLGENRFAAAWGAATPEQAVLEIIGHRHPGP